jgi:outer membrane lipoprotein-sorting protein
VRAVLLALAATLPAWTAAPQWWITFTHVPALESRFRQESDSAVFGKLARVGRLALARGGRLKVAYDGGLQVTCDGNQLVQYDPDTRTAQRMELARAVRDFPLLGILLEPARLERLYRIEAYGGETLKLIPKETGLPELKATGKKGLLHSLEWTDPTGAHQRLELLDPKAPSTLPPATFRPQVPAGTRWSTPNG